jgi:hypothetical protein
VIWVVLSKKSANRWQKCFSKLEATSFSWCRFRIFVLEGSKTGYMSGRDVSDGKDAIGNCDSSANMIQSVDICVKKELSTLTDLDLNSTRLLIGGFGAGARICIYSLVQNWRHNVASGASRVRIETGSTENAWGSSIGGAIIVGSWIPKQLRGKEGELTGNPAPFPVVFCLDENTAKATKRVAERYFANHNHVKAVAG